VEGSGGNEKKRVYGKSKIHLKNEFQLHGIVTEEKGFSKRKGSGGYEKEKGYPAKAKNPWDKLAVRGGDQLGEL